MGGILALFQLCCLDLVTVIFITWKHWKEPVHWLFLTERNETLWKRLFCQVKIRARDVSIVLFRKHNMKNFNERVVKCHTKNSLPLNIYDSLHLKIFVSYDTVFPNSKSQSSASTSTLLEPTYHMKSKFTDRMQNNSKNGLLHIQVFSLFIRIQSKKRILYNSDISLVYPK